MKFRWRHFDPVTVVASAWGCGPVAVVAGMWIHAVVAWRTLGYWPSYGRPDPKSLAVLETSAVAVVGPWVCFAGLLTASLMGLTQISRLQRRWWTAAGVVLLGWTLFVVTIWLDPMGVIEWYVD